PVTRAVRDLDRGATRDVLGNRRRSGERSTEHGLTRPGRRAIARRVSGVESGGLEYVEPQQRRDERVRHVDELRNPEVDGDARQRIGGGSLEAVSLLEVVEHL